MRKAFTLLELSIVLVILGLLTGGVLAGQALIQSAQIRKEIRTATQTSAAVYAFRNKYVGLPGDITNARSFWPACIDNPAIPTNTCNGDGDGRIAFDNGAIVTPVFRAEPERVFEHLSLAGLVAGKYDGNRSSAGPIYPDTQFGNMSVEFRNDGGFYSDTFAKNMLVYYSATPRATPDNFRQFDLKIDDGNALTGTFRIQYEEIPDPGCVDVATGSYLPDSPSDSCAIYLMLL